MRTEEGKLQDKVIAEVKRRRGMAVKMESSNYNGLPDLQIFLPGSLATLFIECKSKSGKLSRIQEKMTEQLNNKYCQIVVKIDSYSEVIKVLDTHQLFNKNIYDLCKDSWTQGK